MSKPQKPKLHPSVEHVLQFFAFEHLPEPLRSVSADFASMAMKIAHNVPDDLETTVALRKLLETKDCAVRAMVSDQNRRQRDADAIAVPDKTIVGGDGEPLGSPSGGGGG